MQDDIKKKIKIPEQAKVVFKGKIFSVWNWDQEMFDGSTQKYESISRNNSTSVVAITKDKKIIVNYEEQPYLGKFISIPGGMGEDGLTELENAKKELLEETGFESEEWELWRIDDVLKNNKIEWNSYIFIARNCEKKQEVKFDPGEKIETHFLEFDDFLLLTQKEEFRTINLKNFVKEILNSENPNLEKEKFKHRLFFGEDISAPINDFKSYKKWNAVKTEIQNVPKKLPFVHAREIWYVYLGENVGYEEDGKGEKFLRPVLVYKVFNKSIFWGIPLTTKGKDTKYYAKLENNSFAILSQIRLIDSKRLSHKMGVISKEIFDQTNKKLKELMP